MGQNFVSLHQFSKTNLLNLNKEIEMKTDQKEMYSPHFSKAEMHRSGVALKLGIDNTPTKAVEENLQALCTMVLEPLRLRFGRIIIASGYRSTALNKAIRGAHNSQHLLGEAADIHVASEAEGRRYFDYIRHHLPFDQLLFEHAMRNGCCWLHVSYRRQPQHNRHEAFHLTAKK